MKNLNFSAAKQPETNFHPIHDLLSGIETNRHVEECILNEHLSHINQWIGEDSPLYWLMICRLNEAALVSAGYYADCGEFSAAGDLLVNPRKIVVHIAGEPAAKKKKRHGRISDQFRHPRQSAAVFRQWFNRNAVIEQRQPPLLPFLYAALQASGRISESYLKTVDTRMKKIADTIVFLSTWGIRDFKGVVERQIQCNEADRLLLENNLCRFDTDLFNHIEMEIQQIQNSPHFSSSILSPTFNSRS